MERVQIELDMELYNRIEEQIVNSITSKVQEVQETDEITKETIENLKEEILGIFWDEGIWFVGKKELGSEILVTMNHLDKEQVLKLIVELQTWMDNNEVALNCDDDLCGVYKFIKENR